MNERSELFNQLYDKLRKLARSRLAGENGVNANGNATSLVHDVYLKLWTWSRGFENETHFLTTASAVMRQILVDRARARKAAKRGAEVEPLSLSFEGAVEGSPNAYDIIRLDETLARLTQFDLRASKIVEMRVFLGLTEEEIAADLDISTRTVKRDWSAASAWLQSEMGVKPARPRTSSGDSSD
jgi:RNA polymerase sigma factor (TIGR02999 family)